MKVYVVTHIMDCENNWVVAVFSNLKSAEDWVIQKRKDDDEYSTACGYQASSDGAYEIDEFAVRENADYTVDEINGLRCNYEKVLREKGFVPPSGSNYLRVLDPIVPKHENGEPME